APVAPAAAAARAGDRGVFVGGFGYGHSGVMYFAPPLVRGGVAHVFVAPYWFAIVMLLIWPVRRIIAQRRADQSEKWRLAGRCPSCGYDLRASPQRCPECGAEAANPSSPA